MGRVFDRALGPVPRRVRRWVIAGLIRGLPVLGVGLVGVLGGGGSGAIAPGAWAQTPPAPIAPPVPDASEGGQHRSSEFLAIQALLDRANAATLANQPDQAARWYRQAIARAAADNPQRVVAHLGLGLLLNQEGEPEQAIAQFDQAIALAPTSAIGYELRGLALFDLQRWDEAIASLQQALERDPQNPSIHVNLANVLYERQDFDRAIAQLRQVIDLMPNHPQPHYNLGLALQDRGQLAEAIGEYEKALALDPQNREIQTALDRARAARETDNSAASSPNPSRPDRP